MRRLASEPRVAREVDLAHATGTEGAEDLVGGERLAGGEGHVAKSLAFELRHLPYPARGGAVFESNGVNALADPRLSRSRPIRS